MSLSAQSLLHRCQTIEDICEFYFLQLIAGQYSPHSELFFFFFYSLRFFIADTNAHDINAKINIIKDNYSQVGLISIVH